MTAFEPMDTPKRRRGRPPKNAPLVDVLIAPVPPPKPIPVPERPLPTPQPAPQPPYEGQTYEYYFLTPKGGDPPGHIDNRFQELGAMGWQFVSRDTYGRSIFMRAK